MSSNGHFFTKNQHEAFRLWQEIADESVRSWLTSPFFLQTNSFFLKQTLDFYENFLHSTNELGFDTAFIRTYFKDLIDFSPFSSKNITTNIKSAQRSGFLPQVAQTPAEIIWRNDDAQLLHYKSLAKKNLKTPVLIVSSLVGKYYILDLTPGRSYVSFLLEQGFDVFIIDWTTTDRSEKLDLEDYTNRFLPEIVKQVCNISQTQKVSLLGYSMGGLLALIHTALHQEQVKNLILLTTPVDFSHAGAIKEWASEKYYEVDRVVDLFGNVSADAVSWSLQAVKPVSSLLRGVNLIQYAENKEDFAALLALEIWLHDATPLPAELFRTVIKRLYRENQLIKNQLKICEQTVDLSNVKCSILNIVGTHDQVATPESSQNLLGLIGSGDKEQLNLPFGHLTIAVGSGAKEEFWRKSAEWLESRS